MTAKGKKKKLLPLIFGNSKLGSIWHFSLDAISTCPGRSEFCSGLCYACTAFYRRNTVNRYKLNEIMRQQKNFVALVTSQIAVVGAATVRVHVSGDFDKAWYIRKWHEIVMRRPNTQFFAYTRSWRDLASENAGEDLWTPLRELGLMPNFQLWLSCDQETGQPPTEDGFRSAYLAENDEDVPPYLTDLVFRNKPKTYKITHNDTLVCPEERAKSSSLTCDKCRICFRRPQWADNFNDKHRLPVLN